MIAIGQASGYVQNSGDKKESKHRTFALNQEIRGLVDASLGHIEVFVQEFEGVAGISTNQCDRQG